MTPARSQSLTDRLAASTSSVTDLEDVSRGVFDTLGTAVPFAFACLATTDPATGLITRAFKSHPLDIGDEEFAAAEYGAVDVNQFAEIARRPVPVGVLSIDTGGNVRRCQRLRDYMTPRFGFTDELRLVCCAQGTTWGLLALYRGEGEPPFTPEDARLLATTHERLAVALREALFADAPAGDRRARVPVVIIVDSDDRVTDVSATALEAIDDLGGWDHGSLPASVLAVAAWARTSTTVSVARVPTRSGDWLTVRGLSLEGPSTARSVVLTLETADPVAVGQMAIAARGLTSREQEVVHLVLQGASTKVIATTLHLSPHTVQDHLKSVFTKLHVNSRREMVAQFVLT